MMQKLTPQEKKLLLQAPIYVCLLAAHHDGSLAANEKRRAIKLTHIKTFSSPRELKEYFKEVEKSFEGDLQRIDKALPIAIAEREKIIWKKLEEIKSIYSKLTVYHQTLLRRNLKTYTRQISRINENIWEEIVMPMLIDFINKKNHEKEVWF